MTDYFYYQATARDDPPEDEGEAAPDAGDPRRSAYPPEDEAYWAEAGAAPVPADEPLWYEDRVNAAEADAGAVPPRPPAFRREVPRDLPTRRATPKDAAEDDQEPGIEDRWQTLAEEDAGAEPWPEAVEADEQGESQPGWPETDDLDAGAHQPRAYVAGAAAAAAMAAAESGERRIRFDPTKERGEVTYDHAARHSRQVRLLKIALPAVALIAVSGFFAVMWVGPKGDGLPTLSLSGINIESRQITMDKPNISGFDGTRRAYEVHAEKATQQLGNPKIVTLETIVARFAIGDKARANIEAVTGVYDGNTQMLKLTDGISLTTTDGYSAEIDHADVDIEKGNIVSDAPVVIRGKEGSITANSIEVLDRGKHIFMRGDVKLVYTPPEQPEEEEPPATEATAGTAETPPGSAPATIEAAPDGST
jgi:lipopolysaccharide export system protein LptC